MQETASVSAALEICVLNRMSEYESGARYQTDSMDRFAVGV